MKTKGMFITGGTALALSLCPFTALAACPPNSPPDATCPITFDPDGAGPGGTINVVTWDWIPNNALVIGGAPSGGLAVGDKTQLRAHAKLGVWILADGSIVAPPAGTEFTFVGGLGQEVSAIVGPEPFNLSLVANFDSTLPNFFEIWVSSPADSNALAGTGYNNSKRILYGYATDYSGNYSGDHTKQENLDQFGTNNYPGIATIVGSGSSQLTGVIIYAHPDYFPGLTPAQVADFKIFFNTSTVTPYKQQDPSANFVGDSAGADGTSPPPANVAANVGAVNGGLQFTGQDLNFILQADSNAAFALGNEIPGACRVTYGGNDKNGNIDLTKFGSACSKDKGKTENCYTFGGQVGAPTANPALGGPFGEHTHHQAQGPAGDFVFHAGTHSAPKTTRITATACKDPGAIRQAEANAGFKQIDFEGTGSFRTLDAIAKKYLMDHGAPGDIDTDNVSDKIYYFRVDMDDDGEPGSTAKKFAKTQCSQFFAADQNNQLSTADPLLSDFGLGADNCADVYQFYVCPSETPCEQSQAMYSVRAFLTGGNIQLHKVVK